MVDRFAGIIGDDLLVCLRLECFPKFNIRRSAQESCESYDSKESAVYQDIQQLELANAVEQLPGHGNFPATGAFRLRPR
jgi:hypothetical protein